MPAIDQRECQGLFLGAACSGALPERAVGVELLWLMVCTGSGVTPKTHSMADVAVRHCADVVSVHPIHDPPFRWHGSICPTMGVQHFNRRRAFRRVRTPEIAVP